MNNQTIITWCQSVSMNQSLPRQAPTTATGGRSPRLGGAAAAGEAAAAQHQAAPFATQRSIEYSAGVLSKVGLGEQPAAAAAAPPVVSEARVVSE